MFKSSFLKAGAIGALVTAMLAAAMPIQAQDRGGREGRGQRAERAERAERPQRTDRSERREVRRAERQARTAPPAQAQAPAQAAPEMQRRGNYGADGRDRSYGANARGGDRGGDLGVQRQTREVQARILSGASPERREWRQEQRTERREDARETRRDYGQGYRQGQTADRRDDRRDQRQAYNQGYRAGDRSDDRRWEGNNRRGDNRRWDNRGWRNDNRYDWQRYRAVNRNVYRLDRYYSPYNNYRYSRINIGFRLGSLFYSNRYWINDPWQYRLPAAYGPYRWVRYYDDALLVDTYSGQVVDVIHDFFW